jgi:hypothetical protein
LKTANLKRQPFSAVINQSASLRFRDLVKRLRHPIQQALTFNKSLASTQLNP